MNLGCDVGLARGLLILMKIQDPARPEPYSSVIKGLDTLL